MPKRALRVFATILVAAALLAGLLWELREAGVITVDDAYITFSFSKNLARGHGPVYGHGVRVEGYSNFLWMVVVAVGLLLRPAADPMVIAHVAAGAFMLLLAASTYRLCRERTSPFWGVAAVAVLVLNADLGTALLIGLETLAHVALFAFAFLLYARSLREPRYRRWVVPAFVAIALNRIDGFGPLGFILAFEAARRLLQREGTVRDYVVWAAPGVVVYVAWFAWRWSYYGMPLPSTYYAKALIPKTLPDRGWEYMRDECMAAGLWVAIPFGLVLLARGGAASRAIVLYVALHLGYVVKTGGDWMPYGRFILPVVPLVVVVVAWGQQEARRALGDGAVVWRRALGVAAGAAALAALAFVVGRTERHLTTVPLQKSKIAFATSLAPPVANLVAAARLLDLAMVPGTRLVTDYGGVLAYYTHAAPIEMWGLCNATIATKGDLERINPIYGKTCAACYPELRPEMFHVMAPLVRPAGAFSSHAEVVANVWQTDTIGRYLDFQQDFVTGRVVVPASNEAAFFLERRRPDGRYVPRDVAPGIFVDYPFVPGGRQDGI